MEIISGYDTDKGLCKENNQDSLCLKEGKTAIGYLTMAVLCDGMGGLNNGEIASSIAVQVFADWFDYKLPAFIHPFSMERVMKDMEEQIWEANRRIMEYGRKHNIRLGTTCSALLLLHNYFYIIVHIGDTRIYEIASDIKVLTTDHTLVEREVSLGNLTPMDAKVDKRRNILLQCLGEQENIHPQIKVGELRKNSVYLLCSDGLYEQCTNIDFDLLSPEHLTTKEQIPQTLKQLVLRSRERKEKDDITGVVIRIMT